MMVEFPKKAMVLAAGLGTRMRAYNSSVPKPLVEVAGKPLIDWSVDMFAAGGMEEVVVNTHYLAEMLEAYLAKRQSPKIQISREETLLETGGGIAKALPMLGDAPFFVTNSDAIWLPGATSILQRMAAAWDGDTMDGLLLLAPMESASGYEGKGDFFLEAGGTLRRRGQQPGAPYIFGGLQLLHPRLFNNCPEGAFSMNVLYNRGMDGEGRLPRIAGLAHDGAWLHVGDPKGKEEAEKILAG